jgi:hypothetical protein
MSALDVPDRDYQNVPAGFEQRPDAHRGAP